jgi:hypothetical protein
LIWLAREAILGLGKVGITRLAPLSVVLF